MNTREHNLSKQGEEHLICLRPANPADEQLLKYWDQQPHVIASAPNEIWDWEVELNRQPVWRKLLIAECDGRPVGFIQIIDTLEEDTHYWSEANEGEKALDIWIGEARDLAKGYGTIMMRLAIDICFSDPTTMTVLIDPLSGNTGARRFYERLGFRFVEYRDFDEDHCAVYRFDRTDWERFRNNLIT